MDDYYLFRHAVLRDAAYLLHPPSVRGELHALALALTRAQFDAPPRPATSLETEPHAVDSVAAELAVHARMAREGRTDADLQGAEVEFLTRAGNHAERNYDHHAAIEAWRRLAAISQGLTRFWGLHRLARAYRAASRLAEAEHAAVEALAAARYHDAQTQAIARGEIALVRWLQGELDEAQSLLLEALADPAGVSPRTRANLTGVLGMVLEQAGEKQRAEQLYREAMTMLRELGDRANEGVFLQNLAGLCLEAGRYDEGERMVHEALRVLGQVGDRASEGISLANLGALYIERRQLPQALEYIERAIAIHRRVGNRRGLGLALASRGDVRRRIGEMPQAAADLHAALEIHTELGNHRSVGKALCELALIDLVAGERNHARWQAGAELLRQHGGERLLADLDTEMRAACKSGGQPPLDVQI